MYLNGKLLDTPWHLDKLDEETHLILHKLREVNHRGFITISGQPGTITTGFHYQTKKPYVEIQRGYLEGFLKKDKYDLDTLTQKLAQKNVWVIAIDVKNYDSQNWKDLSRFEILKDSCPDEACQESRYEKKGFGKQFNRGRVPLTWYYDAPKHFDERFPNKPPLIHSDIGRSDVKSWAMANLSSVNPLKYSMPIADAERKFLGSYYISWKDTKYMMDEDKSDDSSYLTGNKIKKFYYVRPHMVEESDPDAKSQGAVLFHEYTLEKDEKDNRKSYFKEKASGKRFVPGLMNVITTETIYMIVVNMMPGDTTLEEKLLEAFRESKKVSHS
jgi:hypothetical protein